MSKAKQGAVTTLADAGYVAVATAGTTATALMQIMAEKGPDLASSDLTLSAISGFTAAGGAVFASKLANRFTDSTADNIANNDELLRNGDWMRLSALATSELIREYAAHDEELSEPESDSLLELADAVQADWEELANSFGSAYQQLNKAKAITWFRQAASHNPEQRRALDSVMWHQILTEVGQNNSCFPEDLSVLALGVYLRDHYTQAIYRLLKDDEEADRAFRGLLLSTLSTIHEAICERLPNMVGELQETTNETQKQLGNIGVAIDLATYQMLEAMPDEVNLEPIKQQLGDQNRRWNQVVKNLVAAEVVLVENQELLFHLDEQQIHQLDLLKQNQATLENIEQHLRYRPQSDFFETAKPLVNPIPTRISNIGRQMNIRRTFIPRGKLMSKLRRGLRRKRRSAVTQTTAVHGGGGVGKTQLALQYVLKYQDEFEIAWWIRAEEPQALIEDLYELALELGFEESDEKPRVVRKVLGRIERLKNWILVYDNAESTESVYKWLPNSKQGEVILTSRNPNWNNCLNTISVDKMDEGQAVRLLEKQSEQDDDLASTELARRLGYLPLALEIAAAFCNRSGQSLEKYLNLLRERGIEALDTIKPTDYPATISETWRPSFEAAICQETAAETILGFVSFADADNIPIDLLRQIIENELALQNGIAALRDYSLITRRNNTLSIHRLVQDAYRYQLAPEKHATTLTRALRLASSTVKGELQTDLRLQKKFGELFPHIASITHHGHVFFNTGTSLPSNHHIFGSQYVSLVSFLQHEMSMYLQIMDQFAEAEDLILRALRNDEQFFGDNHPNVARDLNSMALLFQATNRREQAEVRLRRALKIDEQFGLDHPNVARDLSNLAQLLKATDKLQEAEPLMRRALQIDEKTFGNEHPRVAAQLSNLAQLLESTSRLEEAELLMRRALQIDEQAFGLDHPNVARDLNNLALLLQSTNRLSESESMMQRLITTLSLIGKQTGHQHPHLTSTLANYAILLDEMGLGEPEFKMRVTAALNRSAQ